MKKLFGVLLVVALVLSFSLVATTPVAAATWTVDAGGGGDFTTIQAAITAANPGDTIIVAAGTYVEQITVYKNLTIMGIDNPTIQAPDSRTTRDDISGHGDRLCDWVVLIEDADDFTLHGFIVDGQDKGGGASRFHGILIGNSAGTVSGNEVTNIRGGEHSTSGIVVVGEDSVVEIEGNEVSAFQKGGIVANLGATATIVGNTVVGDGPIDTIAQNGIQIGFGATGEIIGNDVSGIWYTGTGWMSCGLLVMSGDDVVVEGNTIYDCLDGITLGGGGESMDNPTVRGNEIRDCEYGITVHWNGIFIGDRLIEGNELFDNYVAIILSDAEGWLVTGNIVDGNYGGIGVFDASSDNTIEGNTVTNNDYGVWVSGSIWGEPANTIVRYNSIVGNTAFGLYASQVADAVDATLNWWGDASGPFHDVTNVDGKGDEVSDNVDFEPWYFVVDPDPDIPITSYGELADTATGTGKTKFGASEGAIVNLRTVDESDLPVEGKPYLAFPHGFFALDIEGVTPGGEVTVSIMLPQRARPGTEYWKYYLGAWHQIPMTIDPNDSRIIHITLVDGGLGDASGVPDGTIIDQGGPGNPVTVGWEGSSVNKAAVMAPWLVLLAGIVAGATLIAVRRRGAQTQE